MRQDEPTSQMSEQIQKVVQKALIEEFAHFRLEQIKILREAVEEVLPEMEQRMFEKISAKPLVPDIQYSQRLYRFSPLPRGDVVSRSQPARRLDSRREFFSGESYMLPPEVGSSTQRFDIQVSLMEYY